MFNLFYCNNVDRGFNAFYFGFADNFVCKCIYLIMGEWILRICAISLITSIILLILPQGKMSKYIKGIFSVLIAVSIFSPFIDIDLTQFDYNDNIEDVSIAPDEGYLRYYYQKQTNNKEKNAENILANIGIFSADVIIDYYVNEQHEITINLVEINLQNAVFNSNKLHKDIIEEARKIISDYFLVERKAVVINE